LRRVALFFVASTAIAPACAGKRSTDSATSSSAASAAPDTSTDVARHPVLDVARDLDSCALGHRGVLLDFGDLTMHGQLRPGSVARGDDGTAWSSDPAGVRGDASPAGGGAAWSKSGNAASVQPVRARDVDQVVERGGATWLRVRSRTLSASFYWPAVAVDGPEANTYVEARVRGVTARAVAVAVDGKPVGTWTLVKGEATTVVAHATTPITLGPGGHELGLRFVGGSRGGDALAEIDWVHVGTGEPGQTYAAPTRADALIDATVGDRSMRALSLRAPGFVRCSGWIPANATLEASLATVGGGDADVEAQLLRDRSAPIVLGTAHVAGGGAPWTPWSVPITGLDGDGALASIELVARRAGGATRVLFGSPQIVAARSRAAKAPPRARGVVLVVLGSTSARSLAPWGGPHAVTELARLAASGTTFTANRSSSSLSTAVLASMLTGLPPQVLSLEDVDARLPQEPTTVAEACRQAGVATAMFTANPTTGPAFGFDRGWDSFVIHDPLEDIAATRVFDDAATWIEAHNRDRFLVVVDARGGHPPWDASPDELKSMPPLGYFGLLEPHRAAEALTKARKRPVHFKEEDRVRAWALYDRAVDAHDEALGRLLAATRTAGREDDTVVIVTGDVAVSETPSVPFVDADTLDEPLLATPLVVRWPRADALSGRRVDAPTGPEDVARTVLGALELIPPPMFQGIDLARVAEGNLVPAERPLVATFGGRFAVRWGPFVLVGAHEHETRMCDLSLDPTCVADVRATSPLALEPLHRWAMDALAPVAPAPFPREAAVLDQHTTAALVRWGRATDEREADQGL
jgi:arylsulfatase A-like enzyme